jgi:hypothetical protein
MEKTSLIKLLQDLYGITVLNDWNEHGDRYWYLDIKGHVHTDLDGNNIRFESYDDALDYCIENLVTIEKN